MGPLTFVAGVKYWFPPWHARAFAGHRDSMVDDGVTIVGLWDA